jgi:hypothetical protein
LKKGNDQHIGYVVRRAVIAVCATGFGLLWKHVWPDSLYPGLIVVAGVLMVAITVVALIAVDYLLDFFYAASRKLRRMLALFDSSYIEGAWVDVGLVGHGDARRAANFSFITISFEHGQHKVSGLSWDARTEHPLAPWSSEFSAWERDTLTFWFNEDTGPAREIASRASYRVDGRAKRTPISIAGDYKEPSQEVETRSVRVDASFLADYEASNTAPGKRAPGGADETIEALETASLATLTNEQFERRRQLAKWHLLHVAVRENLAPPNWTAKHPVRFSKDYADWYAAFLKASDEKAAEFALLREFVDGQLASGALDREVKAVLDIGPGNGRLSSALLDKLKTSKFQPFRYTAVEPSVALAATLRDELTRQHPGIVFRQINQRWSEFIEWDDPSTYDLALAFHSLYFSDRPADEIACLLKWVAEGRLKQGAILFHTDWDRSPVLKQLSAATPGSRLCDVVGLTELAAQRLTLQPTAERSGELIVALPSLSNAQWNQLQEANNLVSDEAVRKGAQLLAFLDNMAPNDDGSWESAARTLREALAGSTRLSLPLRIQHFRKP